MSTTLPIKMDDARRWAVRYDCGWVFSEEEEYLGLTVVIELRNEDEATRVTEAILDCLGDAQ